MTIEELNNARKKLHTAEELLFKINAAEDLIKELTEIQKKQNRFLIKGISQFYRDNSRSSDYGYGLNLDRMQILLNEVGINEIESDVLSKILSLVQGKIEQYKKELEEYKF
jgi:hypothetical protein